jgi:hypothetical protein
MAAALACRSTLTQSGTHDGAAARDRGTERKGARIPAGLEFERLVGCTHCATIPMSCSAADSIRANELKRPEDAFCYAAVCTLRLLQTGGERLLGQASRRELVVSHGRCPSLLHLKPRKSGLINRRIRSHGCSSTFVQVPVRIEAASSQRSSHRAHFLEALWAIPWRLQAHTCGLSGGDRC